MKRMIKTFLSFHGALIALGILILSLKPTPSYCAEETVSTAEDVVSPQANLIKQSFSLLPIDQFESNLRKLHLSPPGRLLKQAHDALTKKAYSRALHLSASSLKDATYADYGLWISIQARSGLAELAMSKKNYLLASKLAEKSASQLLQLQRECPYSPFLRNFPTLLAHTEVILGEILWTTKKWQQATIQYERAFQRMQGNNSTLLLKSEVLSHYAQICNKTQTSFCVSWLVKLLASFSEQRNATQAILEAFPQLPEKHHSYRSRGYFATTYKSLDLDAIAIEAALKLYNDEKFNEASNAFEQLLTDYPRTSYRTRVRYWMAQAIAHAEGADKAKEKFLAIQREYPLTYYGLLASLESGVSIENELSATLPVGGPDQSGLLPHEIFHLRRAESFIAENALELAAFELRDFKPRDSISNHFLIYLAMLAHKARCNTLLFPILSELLHRGSEGVVSPYGLHLIFPLDYFETISKNASASQLDPLLVMSLIKQESSFDKSANSPVGAMGLMQLMPYTALETDPNVILSDLLDSNENIRVGIIYLNKLLTRYKGNVVYALGAYNAGPTAMDRWIKNGSTKRGMTEFIESITYRETREYVGAIIRNYFWYTRRIKGENLLNFNSFWHRQPGS